MKYLGKYSSSELEVCREKYSTLYAYTSNEVEIIIYYEKEKAYNVKKIAILVEMTRKGNIYDVYEYEYYDESDKAVKDFIVNLVEIGIKNQLSSD